MRLSLMSIAVAVLAAAAPAAASPVSVRVLECRQGPAAVDRQANFRATARLLPGASRISIRLRLQERAPNGPWRSIEAPGLGVWRRSRPAVHRFAIRQRVRALAEGLAYRVVAGFRWYAADGTLLARARRRSQACRQPGDLPNLRVRRVLQASLVPGGPGVVLYRAEVVNRGRAPAAASALQLSVDGDVVDTVPVPALAPGDATRVQATGPPCGFALVAGVDPADVVREADERDNSLSFPCGPS